MLTDTVQQLQSHKQDVLAKIASLQNEVAKVEEAIAALTSVNAGDVAAVTITTTKTSGNGRNISAAGLARIRAAQKLRWAKFRKDAPVSAPAAKSKPKFSAAGLAKIRAAQKLRWAKFNAAKRGK